MREIHPPNAELVDLLAAWMPAQRWYPLKGLDVDLELERSFALARGVHVHLIRLRAATSSVLIQVPIVIRQNCAPRYGPTFIGKLDSVTTVYDAVADPRFQRALLDACHWDGEPPEDLDTSGARVITGEQSNSSIIFPNVRVAGVTGVIVKVLRTVSSGPNPDLTVPLALARAGWDGVPTPRAWLTLEGAEHAIGHASRPDNVTDGVVGTQDDPRGTLLAVVADLVADADDGFELACAMAGRGEPFDVLAGDLGTTIAEMHAALADVLPDGGPLDAAWLIADLRRRAAEAIEAVPALGERASAITAFHDRVASTLEAADPAHRPRLQAVHGDLHLGQALHGPRGWRVLDFEGEPLRPAAERNRPDLALRDVAGVVRSLDYAGAVGKASSRQWAKSARAAFVDAYTRRAGHSPVTDALLAALTLDRALYEVGYEARNRPTWQPIPLAAVDDLLG